MRILAGLVTIAAFAGAAAQAAPARLTDVAYIQAARCVGLASSGKLGASDADAMKAWLKDQSRGRMPDVRDRADEAQQDAAREADHAGEFSKMKLSAELSGVCASLRR